jgi:hypothetical protein
VSDALDLEQRLANLISDGIFDFLEAERAEYQVRWPRTGDFRPVRSVGSPRRAGK